VGFQRYDKGDLEAYAGSIASSSERNIDPEQFLKQVSNVSTAIGVHRNKSENYILQFRGKHAYTGSEIIYTKSKCKVIVAVFQAYHY
jgi:hypothetical protein